MRHPLALPLCLLTAALFAAATAVRAQPAPPGTPSGLTGAPASADPAYVPIAHQPTPAEITAVLERVRAYVDSATPARLVDRQTQQEITDFSTPNPNAGLERDPGHPFQIASYEWGVTYAAMLSAAEATGDPRFTDFVASRLALMGHALPLPFARCPPAAARPSAIPCAA